MTAPAGLTPLPEMPTEPQRHRPDTRVWVDREGQWRPGVVVASGGPRVTVRWRMTDRGGTGTDTVRWNDLAEQARTQPDQFVDRGGW